MLSWKNSLNLVLVVAYFDFNPTKFYFNSMKILMSYTLQGIMTSVR